MKFEIFNDNGVILFNTEYIECIPHYKELSSMSKMRYKFKINGKIVSIKKINEILCEHDKKKEK